MKYSRTYRQEPRTADLDWVFKIVSSTDLFSKEERDIAVELVEERLLKGEKSGYFFLFTEEENRVLGYTCYGPIMGTLSSYDLYWIAVQNALRRVGLGKELMRQTEGLILGRGGTRIYADTSGRDQYEPTRGFYRACGYREEAVVKDFYAPGDDKIIYAKIL